MGATLQALLRLQEIELQLVDIRREIDRKNRQVGTQSGRLQSAEKDVAARKEQLRRQQLQFNELDAEIKARSAHIDKLRQQLNTVRTNKEYAALLSQMNNEKADLSKLETRTLEIMEELEARKRDVSAMEDVQNSESARLQELRAQSGQTSDTLSVRLERLERQRGEAAAAIDPRVMDQFNRLSQRYDGQALAELTPTDPRETEYICGGCFMAKRADILNALRLRDEIVPCKSCGRILYLRPRA